MQKIKLIKNVHGIGQAGDIFEVWFLQNGDAIYKDEEDINWTIFHELFEIMQYQKNGAIEFLSRAQDIMQQRAQQYDKPDGERSMDATVKAFNAITGRDLTESEGWLLMLILKNVRQWQKPEYHADSAEDAVAYSALLAEALAKGK